MLGELASIISGASEHFARVALKTKAPLRRVSLLFAIQLAQQLDPLNLVSKTHALSVHPLDDCPASHQPGALYVWPRTLAEALDIISSELYANFAPIAAVARKQSGFIGAQLANALHIAHTVHRQENPKARDLKSADLLKELLAEWADCAIMEEVTSSVAARRQIGLPVVPWAKA